ncbi:hypothetical protein M0R45_012642 [Rubus argutus]|uniref:Uncharacterized protein n=1 Tax=Rubus argutus TaxID=59490 RepID=A0AAW1YD94_RUBAR
MQSMARPINSHRHARSPSSPWCPLTADVFRWLARNSSERLDIIAQYWQFVANPEDPQSGDFGYSKQDMKKFGAH